MGDGSNDFCPVLRLRRLVEFVPPWVPKANIFFGGATRGVEELVPPGVPNANEVFGVVVEVAAAESAGLGIAFSVEVGGD